MDPADKKAERPPDSERQKLPYTPPALRVEGTIEDLTQNIGTGTNDALVSSNII